MVRDICFHIIDLVQNAVQAGARNVRVTVRELISQNLLQLEVEDDGKGIDSESLEKIGDPFFTTKTHKKVGLGLPLLKGTAGICHGDFSVQSEPQKGTKISASMEKSHFDCPPLGNLAETVLTLLITLPEINLQFEYYSDNGKFLISTNEIKEQIGDLPLSAPEVYSFLKKYFQQNLQPLIYFN